MLAFLSIKNLFYFDVFHHLEDELEIISVVKKYLMDEIVFLWARLWRDMVLFVLTLMPLCSLDCELQRHLVSWDDCIHTGCFLDDHRAHLLNYRRTYLLVVNWLFFLGHLEVFFYTHRWGFPSSNSEPVIKLCASLSAFRRTEYIALFCWGKSGKKIKFLAGVTVLWVSTKAKRNHYRDLGVLLQQLDL